MKIIPSSIIIRTEHYFKMNQRNPLDPLMTKVDFEKYLLSFGITRIIFVHFRRFLFRMNFRQQYSKYLTRLEPDVPY